MVEPAKTKACKRCGKEFPREQLSSKGFCAQCILRRYLDYHETAAAHYRKLLEEDVS